MEIFYLWIILSDNKIMRTVHYFFLELRWKQQSKTKFKSFSTVQKALTGRALYWTTARNCLLKLSTGPTESKNTFYREKYLKIKTLHCDEQNFKGTLSTYQIHSALFSLTSSFWIRHTLISTEHCSLLQSWLKGLVITFCWRHFPGTKQPTYPYFL